MSHSLYILLFFTFLYCSSVCVCGVLIAHPLSNSNSNSNAFNLADDADADAADVATIAEAGSFNEFIQNQFMIQGLSGAEYSSFIMGDIGEYPSDNVLHGGGYGSVMSSIGPSKFDHFAQSDLAFNSALSDARAVNNPIAEAYQRSIGYGGTDVTLGIIGPRASGTRGWSGSASQLNTAGGTQTINGVPLTSPPPRSNGYPSFQGAAPTLNYPRDSYAGIASNLGLGTQPSFNTAMNLVGPAYPGVGKNSPFSPGFDDVSATVISSRINGIPQAVAGGRMVSRFGSHHLDGVQTVSAWTEAPDFTRLI